MIRLLILILLLAGCVLADPDDPTAERWDFGNTNRAGSPRAFNDSTTHIPITGRYDYYYTASYGDVIDTIYVVFGATDDTCRIGFYKCGGADTVRIWQSGIIFSDATEDTVGVYVGESLLEDSVYALAISATNSSTSSFRTRTFDINDINSVRATAVSAEADTAVVATFSQSSSSHYVPTIWAVVNNYSVMQQDVTGGTNQGIDQYFRCHTLGVFPDSANGAIVDSVQIYINSTTDTTSFLFGLYTVAETNLPTDTPDVRTVYQTTPEQTDGTSTGWYTFKNAFTGTITGGTRYSLGWMDSDNADDVYANYTTKTNYNHWSTSSYTFSDFASGLPADGSSYTWFINTDRALGIKVFWTVEATGATGQIIIWQ